MKKWTHILLRIALSLALLLSLAACRAAPGGNYNAKPVIYLYPGEETEVSVKLDFDGVLTSTYPAYGSGWTVTARPDGTLTDETGREYYCLFWEGLTETEYDFSTGFCVAGEDTAAFLEDALARLGLTDKEAEEFIIYWLPRMEGNAYNLIAIQRAALTAPGWPSTRPRTACSGCSWRGKPWRNPSMWSPRCWNPSSGRALPWSSGVA